MERYLSNTKSLKLSPQPYLANDVLLVLHYNSLAMEEPLKVDVWLVFSDIHQLQQKIDPFLALSVKYLLVKFTL